MKKVRNFDKNKSIRNSKMYLKNIHLIYESLKINPQLKNKTYQFYISLLDSNRYKKLHPYLFYYISKFFQTKEREKYLLKSLKFALTPEDQQFIFQHLYDHYKSEKINYLAQSYLKKLIEVQTLNKDYMGVETSLIELAQILKKKMIS